MLDKSESIIKSMKIKLVIVLGYASFS